MAGAGQVWCPSKDVAGGQVLTSGHAGRGEGRAVPVCQL